MQNGKYQYDTAASCTYHLPAIISWPLNKSDTKKKKIQIQTTTKKPVNLLLVLMKNIREVSWEKMSGE